MGLAPLIYYPIKNLLQFEWENLVRVVIDLADQYKVVKDQLMGDADITLELERSPWLAILKGDQYGWSPLGKREETIPHAYSFGPSGVSQNGKWTSKEVANRNRR